MTKINTDQLQKGKHLSKPRILVAPLDWGLGHASRCVPVICELINQGADVWLAGEGAQEALLRTEFPGLPFLPLQGYRVRYSRSSKTLVGRLLLQSPGILRNIRAEHSWLRDAVAKHGFDAVISDNRFGLYHPGIKTVFITHQLLIKAPWQWTERWLQKNNYKFINLFNECWIPDWAGVDNLAGDLSHPQRVPAIPLHYIGHLSRLYSAEAETEPRHLFVSLSGPEPQRSLLEDKLINSLSHYKGTATIVRGLPSAQSIIPSTNDLRFHNHLSTKEFDHEMLKADYVISRSGYSTVMDIAALGKRSILIPTPGQTEQEYLGKYLMGKRFALSISQQEFSLELALDKASRFPYLIYPLQNNRLRTIMSEFLKNLNPGV